jgi:Fe-S cluster assembly protein SufD
MIRTFTDITNNVQDQYVIDEPGEHVFFMFNVSGNITFEITKPSTSVKVFGVMLGHDADSYNLNTTQKHIAEGSESDLFVKGVFTDASRFVYHGLIDIAKSAQKTNAMQTNRNLVLSKDAMVTSEPYLEIQADDVKCKHASATGKLNPEDLYYAMTRGISEKQATRLLVNGFVDEVFEKVAALGYAHEVAEYKKQAENYVFGK